MVNGLGVNKSLLKFYFNYGFFITVLIFKTIYFINKIGLGSN